MASSSKRSLESLQTGREPSKIEFPFLCLNLPQDYLRGALILPDGFIVQYGDTLPERVYLKTPSGDLWFGTFVKRMKWIEGLDAMMLHYCLKPYSMVAFQFHGGSNFSITVFNPYAMEINYPPYSIQGNPMTPINIAFELHDNEIDKLNGIFIYNAYNSCLGDYDVLIGKEHLKRKAYYKVLDNDACSQLGLDESITWIKIGFKCLKFKIKLNWCKGMLLFDNGWHVFAKAMNIRKGDVLVFQSTSHPHKYEISVFEKKIIGKYMRIEGKGHAHTMKKWFKILNEATVYTGEMEIPRKYVDNYGWTVGEHVKLIITDGREYSLKFLLGKNVLYGLSDLVERYSLSKNCVLVFTYLEFSTFSVEIFDPNNMKITMAGRDDLDIVLYHNSESVGTTASRNIILPENTVDERINEFEFTVIIKDSHIDQEGHGIYISRNMLSVYKPWRNSQEVKLRYNSVLWNVQVHRKEKMCRFGLGWNEFTLNKNFLVGKKLRFVYRNNYTFDVFYLA